MFDDYYDFRRRVVEALERDVLGPESLDETITDPPTTKYISGVLFPSDSSQVDPAQDLGEGTEIDGDSDQGESWDPAVSMSYVRYPSSMGMTLVVDTAATGTINVSVGGARYVPVEPEKLAVESAAGTGAHAEAEASSQYFGKRARPREQPVWHRVPLEVAPIEIDLTKPAAGKTTAVDSGLELFQRIRPADGRGRVSITLVLINTRKSSSSGAAFGNDADSFFQAALRTMAPGGGPVFVHRPHGAAHVPEEDVASDRLLY